MIKYHEKTRVFHIQTNNTSYIFKVLGTGHITQLYYGEKIGIKENYDSLDQQYVSAPGNSTVYSTKSDFCLNVTPLEFGTYGKGDYREPTLHLQEEDGNRTFDFLYVSHEIYEGKEKLSELASIELSDEDGQSLALLLKDEVSGVKLYLKYSVIDAADIIIRSMELVNSGSGPLKIQRMMSFNWDDRYSDYDLISLEGQWIRERHINKYALKKGRIVLDSKKGVSSSDYNPFLCLAKKTTTECTGKAYGFALIYSGSHESSVEVTPYGFTRIQMGIQSFDFEWLLKPGESFQTPEAVLTFSAKGFNGMSRNFHQMINDYLIPKYWRRRERPILANNWEATYFDFDHNKIKALVDSAKELGIELFVLDDGWFMNRNNDRHGLGDWIVDYDKLEHGIDGIAHYVHQQGLEFGLWVEPEMVNKGTALYRKHPEWIVGHPRREVSPGRNQYILDLTNDEVIDYLENKLSSIFEHAKVDYIKWDMNRNFSDLYSSWLEPERQQEFVHRYVLGLYKLLERLVKRFPKVLFESCSSGGNRFDMGMLAYMPQTWTSDNTDALARYKIQYGTSYVFPLSTMGAHVSGEKSHQVLRKTPLETRFNVAAFGVLGYELDLINLSNTEREIIKEQVEFYKKHRRLFQFGDFNRLQSPFENNHMHWQVLDRDKKEAILGEYQQLQEASPVLDHLDVINLDEEARYHLVCRKQHVDEETRMISESFSLYASGDELLKVGIRPFTQFMGVGINAYTRILGDFGSRLYLIEKE